jgi:5-methylcytosine-specific restriction protein A
MTDAFLIEACDMVATEIGVALSVRDTNPDAETTFHFEDLGRNAGINFTLSPGLNRFSVIAAPGGFSKHCIEQIRRATTEQISNAEAHLGLAAAYASDSLRILIGGNSVETPNDVYSWSGRLTDDFRMTLVRRGFDDPNSPETVREVISNLMIPVVGTFAELIGYERKQSEIDFNESIAPDTEGEVFKTTVLRRERSQLNRALCIRFHGDLCSVCGFSFGNFYGEMLKSFIEVHHLEPLSELEKPRRYDPRTDLIPLCANCHRAVHIKTPPLSPNELKEIIAKQVVSE